jgi:hypothetical protein
MFDSIRADTPEASGEADGPESVIFAGKLSGVVCLRPNLMWDLPCGPEFLSGRLISRSTNECPPEVPGGDRRHRWPVSA